MYKTQYTFMKNNIIIQSTVTPYTSKLMQALYINDFKG